MRLLVTLLGFAAASSLIENVAIPAANPKCPDLDKAVLCEDDCTTKLYLCVKSCGGGPNCITGCNRDVIKCIDGKLNEKLAAY